MAELEACFTVADTFKTDFGKCLEKKLSIDDQCKCVEALADPEADLQVDNYHFIIISDPEKFYF